MTDNDSQRDSETNGKDHGAQALAVIMQSLDRRISRIEEDKRRIFEIVGDSETTGRLDVLLEHAMSYFNDPDKAVSWIIMPNRGLAGRRPIDLLGSDEQAERPHQVITALEHSIIS